MTPMELPLDTDARNTSTPILVIIVTQHTTGQVHCASKYSKTLLLFIHYIQMDTFNLQKVLKC